MTASVPHPISAQPRAAGFAAVFAGTVVIALALVTGLTLWRDPFWVFRDAPPWTRDGLGASQLIDLEMRRVKPLQIARLRPGTVLVGSSVVYRGLDPSDLNAATPRPVYNAGLSSLMAAELPVMAALLRDVGSVRRVVIGLDYFMFTELPPPPALPADLASAAGRRGALLSAVLNSGALSNLTGRSSRRAEPGAWRGDGFKTTPDFDAALTRKVAASQNVGAMGYRPERLADLELAIKRLAAMDVVLYLSPMSGAQRGLLEQAGRGAELARWRADVVVLAGAHGLELQDFLSDHPFDDFDPARGSSHHWIDNMHFKPEVGRWVLARLKLG